MNAVAMPAARPVSSMALPRTRLLYWSIRRELWEHRAIVYGPSIVAVLVLVSFVLGARRMTGTLGAIEAIDRFRQAPQLATLLNATSVPIVVTATIIALFYCLDALHGERRDRSILFWKSLPVSDGMTVLSKVLIPLAVLPAVACVTSIVLQLVILVVASVILALGGLDGNVLWMVVPMVRHWPGTIYGIVGLALWHAPIYGWCLLVSGWSRRSTFLVAVLPPLAICLVERIAFDTDIAWSLLKDRLFGFADHGSAFDGPGGGMPDPLVLLATPGLWFGLVVAALLVFATVWFRRYRQPI